MTTPLFNLLARNLGKADVDRMISTLHRKNRNTSPRVINAWLVANELFKSGASKYQAAKEAGVRHQVGWMNIYNNWERIEAAAKAQK